MILADLLDPATILMTLLMFFGILLIIIILLQKGRGGGLAGAFGGAGGQSALGTKAGDIFTKITIVMAVIWVILAGVSGITTRASSGKYAGGSEAVSEEPSVSAPESPDDKAAADAKTEETSSINPFDEKKPTDKKEAAAKPEAEPAKKADEKPAPTENKPEPAKPTAASEPAEKKQETPAKPEAPKSETKPN